MVTVGIVLGGAVVVGDGDGVAGRVAGGSVGASGRVFDRGGIKVFSGKTTEDTGVTVGASVGVAGATGGSV